MQNALCNRHATALILGEGVDRFVTITTEGSSGNPANILRLVAKTARVMQLTAIILTACCLSVTAKTVSQSVTYTAKGAKLQHLFEVIEKQTGFFVFFEEEKLQRANLVTIDARQMPLTDFLDRILNNQPLSYSIQNTTITIKSKTEKKAAGIRSKLNFSPPPITVRGRIVNEKGEPVVASVIIKGTRQGTSSDVNGFFELAGVDEKTVLIISGANINQKELIVDGKAELNISVTAKIIIEEEVVINAGYYSVKDKERTGNISRIDAKTIEKQPVTNPLQAMQGRVPGISITQSSGVPGANIEVRIRGDNSLTGGNDPLYIIDGVPFISNTLTNGGIGQSLYGIKVDRGNARINGVSPLNSINPGDIASIEVLKDADATAIYGSRGANGVILITTKKGKAGKLKLDLDIKSGASKITNKVKLLNTEQYLQMRMMALNNDGITTPSSTAHDINGDWDKNRYTDWQDALIGGSAKMNDFNASLSAGTNETQFIFSAAYNEQGTVFPGNDKARRFSTHFSVSHTSLNKKFNTRFSTSYITSRNNIINFDLTSRALTLAPNAPRLFDDNGKINWENSTWSNPLAQTVNRYSANTYNLLTNIEMGYEIIEQLRFKINVGMNDIRNADREKDLSTSIRPIFNYTAANYSNLKIASAASRSWIAEPQLSWETTISKGKLSVLTGATYQYKINESDQSHYSQFPSNSLVDDPNSAGIKDGLYSSYSEYKYAAVYGRINYAWNEKYIANFTGRKDASSRFGPGKKTATLGAVGVAWIFSNERFINNNYLLSFGKIRGSYGLTGNDEIGDYKYLDIYRSGLPPYQGNPSLVPANLFNAKYGWEVNKKLEVAVDLGFLKDRISFSAAAYRNRSSNQLIDYKLASTAGFSGITRNLPATVQNTGLEFELNTVNIVRKSFRWTTAANITIPKNKLIAFPGLESSSYANTFMIGKALNLQKLYRYVGVDPLSGLYQVEDINGDGQFTIEDQTAVVELVQHYYGGINNSISFKGIQLDVLFQFVSQQGILPSIGYGGGAFEEYMSDGNIPARVKGSGVFESRWQKPGDVVEKQLFSTKSAAESSRGRRALSDISASDFYFIRLKNISLYYQLPDRILKKVKTRLYLQGQNIFTHASYPGLDPESGAVALPPMATMVAGIQLTF